MPRHRSKLHVVTFSPLHSCLYVSEYHGEFKVLIPSEEAIYEPDDYRGQRKSDVLYYMLNKRMGAEIDYVIRGVDPETGMAGGSRMEAMALKRKAYFYKTDRNGNYQLYVGSRAEARVVSVIRAGIFVDLFGAECYIPLKELSYQRWVDAAQHYQPGQRVLIIDDFMKGGGTLRDRKGRDFTVTCSAPGGAGVRTVYNPVPLYMGERLSEMPVDVAVAAFTIETPARVSQILALLLDARPFDNEFTRGLYYTNN